MRKERIFKVGRRGTREVTVEQAPDARAACYKAGWAPEWCRVMDITEEIKVVSGRPEKLRLRENA